VLQLPPAHPEHPDEAPALPILLLAAPLSPPLLNPQTDIFFCTFDDVHLGQLTGSSLLKTSVSNSSQQSQHAYSYIGISNLRVIFDHSCSN